MAEKFEYTYNEPIDDIIIFNLKGEITESSEDIFKRKFYELMDEGKTHFIFNMRDIKYVNSSGLGLMAGMLKNIRQKKGEIKLSEVNKMIKNILEISKLTRVFAIYDNTETALNDMKMSLDKNVY